MHNAASGAEPSLDELLSVHGAMALHFGPAAYGVVESAVKAKPTAVNGAEAASAYIARLRRQCMALVEEHGELARAADLLLRLVEEAYTTCTPIEMHPHDDEDFDECPVCLIEALLAGEHPDDDDDDEEPAGGDVPPAAETPGGNA